MTQKTKLAAIFGGLGVMLAIVIAVGSLMYGVYVKHDESSVTRVFAKAFHFPAARVGMRTVSYSDFLSTRDAIIKFINSEAGAQVDATMPPDKALNDNIMERLVRQEMIQEMADDKSIAVSDDDISAVFDDVVKAAASSTTPDVAQYLQDNYGWSEQDFRQNVLKPALLEQKVTTQLGLDPAGNPLDIEAVLAERRVKADVVVYLKFQ
ncbi:MAG: SurA N-terminal domain-containing protein [Patescibacteria group bacterium]|jgi:hypothetical protein